MAEGSTIQAGVDIRFLSDAQLRAACREDRYRGSGPGGQKRNKTSNAVRLVHLETGLVVTATESRSLAENQLYAVRRMRFKLVAERRERIDLTSFLPPDWFVAIRRPHHIDASFRHPSFAAAGGLVLDLMAAVGGNPASVAINLGVSTTAVLKLLEQEPQFWQAANKIRAHFGLPSLTHRR